MLSWRRKRWLVGIIILLGIVTTTCQQPEPRIPIILDTFPVEISGPQDIAVNSRTGYVYIINNGHRVAVLQGVEQVALLEVDMARTADTFNLAIDEERGWIYVVDLSGDSVIVIRETEIITVLEIPARLPQQVAVDPERGWAYVVSGHEVDPETDKNIVAGNVTVIKGTEIIGTIPLGRVLATHVIVNSVDGYVYVGGVGGEVVVLQEMEEIARFELDWGVTHMDVNQQTGEVFVSDDFYLHRFVEGKLLQTMRITEGNGNLGNMQVHPTTGDVYLIEWSGFGQTEAIVIRDFKEIARLLIGSGSAKMTIDPVSGYVYMADYLNDQITVIHGMEVIATLETGWYPYGIGVNPTNGWVYVSNTNEGTISVLGFPEEKTP